MRRIPVRVAKVPIFVGCEGQSEIALAGLVNRFCHLHDKPFSLKPHNSMGGSPANIVSSSIRKRDQIGRREFQESYVLVDADRLNPGVPDYAQVLASANRAGFRLVIAKPCIEVTIYRLVCGIYDGHIQKAEAIRRIRQAHPTWSHFGERTVTVRELEARVTLDMLRRYAQSDADMHRLIDAVGLLGN